MFAQHPVILLPANQKVSAITWADAVAQIAPDREEQISRDRNGAKGYDAEA